MASKAKKRKRDKKRKTVITKRPSDKLSLRENKREELGWVKKGLLKSFASSLVVMGVILVVYFLNQKGAN